MGKNRQRYFRIYPLEQIKSTPQLIQYFCGFFIQSIRAVSKKPLKHLKKKDLYIIIPLTDFEKTLIFSSSRNWSIEVKFT